MKYPDHAAKLLELLAADQTEWKAFTKSEYVRKIKGTELANLRHILRENVAVRAQESLVILDRITEPSISNVGAEAAQALSILATHHSLPSTKKVLESFIDLYEKSPLDTYRESIPAMTDWVAVLEHRPQVFGTMWLFDANRFPFLPTVEDIEHVDERRQSYGIEPFRWPKSLVIPENEQAWLLRPISEAVMRKPTSNELVAIKDY